MFQMAQDNAGDSILLEFTTTQIDSLMPESVSILKIDETLDEFQSSGSSPMSMVLWYMLLRTGEISWPYIVISVLVLLSHPQAWFGFIFFRSFSTPFVVTEISGMDR